jgi:DnaJ-class molecular chaperone
MRDPYTVLGVAKDAKQDDIKKAYRKLAKELHPDKNTGNAKIGERFKEVSAAYSIVGDDKQRARYDRGEIDAAGTERAPNFGQGGPGGGPFRPGNQGPWGARGGPRGRTPFEDAGANPGMGDDIFSDLFGGFGRRGPGGGGGGFRPARGEDRKYALKVGFLDAARGTKRRITLPDGKSLDVNIPAGITSGQQIRLKGQGEPGPQAAGDALIEVEVEPHAFFTREGNDVRVDLPIGLKEAVLGAKVTAPTIDGMVTLTVPKNSSSGATLRLKGKGIKGRGDTPAGDLYVRLKVMLPAKPDAALEKAVADLPDETGLRDGFTVE